MVEREAKLSYSFGEIKVKVTVDGNVDRPYQLIDHMLATATAVTSINAIQLGITESQRNDERLQQKSVTRTEIGEIQLQVELEFNFKQHVSKRTVNSLVFSNILPKIWQTAGLYFGDGQSLTTPPAPMTQQLRRDIDDKIDAALGLEPAMPSERFSQQPSDTMQRQQTVR